ncbi:MAG TPA: Arc family DNA-binding protein [Myxococcota bacterium]|nr:Arc family DNA-binding protein [Myxococcota bacterium]
MPGLLIKMLPDDIHARLKKRAAENRRSLSSEVILLLQEALADRAGPPTLAELDGLRIRGGRPLTQDILDNARQTGRP